MAAQSPPSPDGEQTNTTTAADSIVLVNPDNHLGQPRVWTPERSRLAWETCYARIERSLREHGRAATVYVVCGVQGSGKTTWIRQNTDRFRQPAIVFDAALPGRRHRERVITLARHYGSRIRAVWINTPLGTALARNSQRAADQQVPEAAILSVNHQFEAPAIAEGFDSVEEILT